DPQFYMYSDEYDLSWRVWIAGSSIVFVPAARLHHRGAASVNPAGGGSQVELRTSDTKRFYTNRNGLLLLVKNCEHVLLWLVPLQMICLTLENLVLTAFARRWSFFKRAFLDALRDCWRLRRHIFIERQRVRTFRQRSDWQLL